MGRRICRDDPVPPLPARHSRCRGLCVRGIADALAHLPGSQIQCGGPVVLRRRFGRLRLRPGLRESHERCLFGLGLDHADWVPRPLLDA